MIEKKWLVRTFDKKILGPISREKLISLIVEKKLSESDEICPGNHYWVFIKEKVLCAELLESPEILDESLVQRVSTGDNSDLNSKDTLDKKKNS